VNHGDLGLMYGSNVLYIDRGIYILYDTLSLILRIRFVLYGFALTSYASM
jgi:hypothetical protein